MSVSVRASSTASNLSGSTAVSVARPTGTTTGDVVIVIVSANGQTTSITDNNGATPFTEDLVEITQVSMTVSIFSRRIQASDPSTYAFTLGSSQRWTVHAVTFKDPNAAVIYDVVPAFNANANTAVTTVDAPSITTLSKDAMHCAICAVDGITLSITGTPSGYTVQQNTGDQVVAFTTKTIPLPGATGAQTFTHTAQTSFGISFAIRSATYADNFNRSSIGTEWEAAEGSLWTIASSLYLKPVSFYMHTSVRAVGSFPNDQLSEMMVEVAVTGAGDATFAHGPAVRIGPTGDCYFLWVELTKVGLYKRTAGSYSGIADSAPFATLSADTFYKFKLVVTGTSLEVFLNDVSILTATDSAITAGNPGAHALTGEASKLPRFDDFLGTIPTPVAVGSAVGSCASILARQHRI